MNKPLLLAATAAAIVAIVAAAGGALAHDTRQRRLAARIADQVTPLASFSTRARPLADRLRLNDLGAAAQARLARLCGFRADRREAYPLPIAVLLLLVTALVVPVQRMIGRTLGISLDLGLPLMIAGCSRLLFGILHARYADKLYRQFPDALSMIVRSVRAGIPLHEALRVVARESLEPTAGQFTRVADQMAIGIRLDEALREAALRTGVAEYAFFTVALTLQAQTGGSLAETLENLADVIRKRVALRLRAIALASEARTSAYVLAALPVVTGVILCAVDYDYIRPLFETRDGNRVLLGAICLLTTAGVIMRLMITRSLR